MSSASFCPRSNVSSVSVRITPVLPSTKGGVAVPHAADIPYALGYLAEFLPFIVFRKLFQAPASISRQHFLIPFRSLMRKCTGPAAGRRSLHLLQKLLGRDAVQLCKPQQVGRVGSAVPCSHFDTAWRLTAKRLGNKLLRHFAGGAARPQRLAQRALHLRLLLPRIL